MNKNIYKFFTKRLLFSPIMDHHHHHHRLMCCVNSDIMDHIKFATLHKLQCDECLLHLIPKISDGRWKFLRLQLMIIFNIHKSIDIK